MTRLIDADELKEWVKNWLYKDSYYFPRRRKETIPASELYDVIDQVPTVQAYQTVQDVTIEVPVRHGRWEDCSNGWMCSECGDEWSPTDAKMIFGFNYCPNCGARMVGGKW